MKRSDDFDGKARSPPSRRAPEQARRAFLFCECPPHARTLFATPRSTSWFVATGVRVVGLGARYLATGREPADVLALARWAVSVSLGRCPGSDPAP